MDETFLLENRLTLRAISKFGVLLIYFYLCDRTILFGESKKSYNRDLFLFFYFLLIIVSAITSFKIHHDKSPISGKSILSLNMHQTEEWKGWMQPGQNPEYQRQMMVPELQMQVAQGNSQGVPPFVGLSSAFSNQTSPPAQTYPLHPQQAHVLSNSHHPYLQGPNHAASTQHQAYAMRIAKERQMQQRLQLHQQHQQQFAASNALMPHVQSQSQLPMSSSMQNSSQVQPQRRTGMPRFKAREVVTEAIQRKGLYRGAKNNEMRLGICSRSNDVVEPLIKPQWYVNCNSMAKQALDAVFDDKNRKMEIIPKQYAAEWKRWLENIRD